MLIVCSRWITENPQKPQTTNNKTKITQKRTLSTNSEGITASTSFCPFSAYSPTFGKTQESEQFFTDCLSHRSSLAYTKRKSEVLQQSLLEFPAM